MKMFKNVFFSVIFLVIVNIVILFFLFLDHQKNCLEDFCFIVSDCCMNQVNIDKSKNGYKNSIFMISEQDRNVQSAFLMYVYVLLNDCCIFYNFLRSLFLSMFEMKIYDSNKNFLNRLMHQSFDLLNSDLIFSTMTVIKLELKSDSMFWVIQLGAFSDFQRAEKIVNKLKTYNYPVFIFPKNSELEGLVRVFVGPYYSSKESLSYVLDDLYHVSFLSGKIFPYHEIKR